MDKLLENLVQRWWTRGRSLSRARSAPRTGAGQCPRQQVKFEVTDKSLDFLGFKTLKDLTRLPRQIQFRPPRHARPGHRYRKPPALPSSMEFGDTLNLDISETLFSAIRREGAKVPLDMDYSTCMCTSAKYQSSCATGAHAGLQPQHAPVRRGPLHTAKKVAARVSPPHPHSGIPATVSRCVLFHDTAEELAVSQLARVQVGPYYTNTRRFGLILRRNCSIASARTCGRSS